MGRALKKQIINLFLAREGAPLQLNKTGFKRPNLTFKSKSLHQFFHFMGHHINFNLIKTLFERLNFCQCLLAFPGGRKWSLHFVAGNLKLQWSSLGLKLWLSETERDHTKWMSGNWRGRWLLVLWKLLHLLPKFWIGIFGLTKPYHFSGAQLIHQKSIHKCGCQGQ